MILTSQLTRLGPRLQDDLLQSLYGRPTLFILLILFLTSLI